MIASRGRVRVEWTLNASSESTHDQTSPGSTPPFCYACAHKKKEEGESQETRLVFIPKELNAEVGAVWLRARLVQARPNYVNSADTSRILMT